MIYMYHSKHPTSTSYPLHRDPPPPPTHTYTPAHIHRVSDVGRGTDELKEQVVIIEERTNVRQNFVS